MVVDRTVGSNTNVSDEETFATIALNANTTIKVLDANKDRYYISLVADGGEVWIKYRPAATDNDKNGVAKLCDGQQFEFPSNQIYVGEISAIAVDGTPNLYATEL